MRLMNHLLKVITNPEGRYWNEWAAPDRRHGFDFYSLWHLRFTFKTNVLGNPS